MSADRAGLGALMQVLDLLPRAPLIVDRQAARPLPAGPACTQILCKPGEPNAGVCPSDWPCMEFPPNPSACLKL